MQTFASLLVNTGARAGVIVALFLGCAPSYAWNATGHKATAEIAFELLLPEQQADVARVLRAHPRLREDFLEHMPDDQKNASDAEQTMWLVQHAATWPDILRELDDEEQAKYGRSVWHYINLPIYLEAHDQKDLEDKLDHNMAFDYSPPLRQNLNGVQALKGNLQIWHDAKASDEEKAVALCWILHLVGDLHQPLHTVALFSRAYFPEGDRGGNSVSVAWNPEPINLHAVWDRLPNQFENLQPDDLTQDLLRTDVATVTAIDFWLDRHAQLAKAHVYTDEVKESLLEGFAAKEYPAIPLSDFYLDNARRLAKEQVILAGHRIAGLLQ